MQCTWKDCSETATHAQRSRDGSVWVNLCDTHHAELESAINGDDWSPKKMLSAWAKAHGTPQRFAERMMRSA